MKRYCKNFVFTQSHIEKCIIKCIKTRWKRKDVAHFFAEYACKYKLSSKDVYLTAKLIHYYIKLGFKEEIKDNLIPLIAKDMLEEINNHEVKFRPIRYQERRDPSSMKLRHIGISSIKQQVYDYIVIEAMKEMLNAKIGKFQCASLKGRGQIYAKKRIEKWLRKDSVGTKYWCKEDVYHYYPSVPHDTLKAYLKRDIKNDELLYVVFSLIDTYEQGLCIGSYLSQYLGNYYLSYLYHYIEDNCFMYRRGKRVNFISHKLFYADDIILFSPNLKNLQKARKMANEFLNKTLHLRFKTENNFHRRTEMIDMVGYKITIKSTTIRKRNFKRIRRLLIRYKNKIRIMSLDVARKIISYYGLVVNSDSTKINRKYNIERTVNRAKEKVRCWDILQNNLAKNGITSYSQTEMQMCLSMI